MNIFAQKISLSGRKNGRRKHNVGLLQRINGIDLFSGIGGNTLGLSEWVKTICYCEQDLYAQSVLLSRMRDGSIDPAPIWNNVRTLCKELLPEKIDIIVAGFPCQDISAAGEGRGLKGRRSGLFYEIIRLAKELDPAFIFLENVAAIRHRGLSEVARSLTEIGYDCRWTCISASDIGAPHRRERWFLLAHSNRDIDRGEINESSGLPKKVPRFHRQKKPATRESAGASAGVGGQTLHRHGEADWNIGNWQVEPRVGRVANGVPFSMERNKCLGNAVVPLQARAAFEKLIGLKE